jgi:hypothetical protein
MQSDSQQHEVSPSFSLLEWAAEKKRHTDALPWPLKITSCVPYAYALGEISSSSPMAWSSAVVV